MTARDRLILETARDSDHAYVLLCMDTDALQVLPHLFIGRYHAVEIPCALFLDWWLNGTTAHQLVAGWCNRRGNVLPPRGEA